MQSNFSCCRWVRAANEFLDVLHSSPYMHQQKKVENMLFVLNKLIDKGLFFLLFYTIFECYASYISSWCTKWSISSGWTELLFSLLLATQVSKPKAPLDSSIDQSPYINVTEDGMVAALNNEPTENQKKNK